MVTYENGVLIAFLFWLYQTVMTLVLINSRFERNLNKIGLRLSWYSVVIKPMTAADKNASALRKILKFLFIASLGLAGILLSWLTVAWQVGAILYFRHKNAGEPRAVQEFKWKLKNVDLTFEQVVREFMKAGEEDATTYEAFRDDILNGMQERGLA